MTEINELKKSLNRQQKSLNHHILKKNRQSTKKIAKLPKIAFTKISVNSLNRQKSQFSKNHQIPKKIEMRHFLEEFPTTV